MAVRKSLRPWPKDRVSIRCFDPNGPIVKVERNMVNMKCVLPRGHEGVHMAQTMIDKEHITNWEWD